MVKTVCKAVKNGEVPRRGKSSVEWHKEGRPQYYCYGWKNSMTDELMEVCANCKDNVIHAQDDMDKWKADGRTQDLPKQCFCINANGATYN